MMGRFTLRFCTISAVTSKSLTRFWPGRLYIRSSISSSRIMRRPRAPTLRNMASLEMQRRASSVKRSLTFSNSNRRWYCFTMAFFGLVRISTRASSSRSLYTPTTGSNIELRIERDGDEYVLNRRKWWASGLIRPRCKIMIVMGKTDPEGHRYRQQSMILVPRETPGVTIVRNLPVFGYISQEGHGEVTFEDVRVPAANLIGNEGDGFLISQARLGPGRIHHCMRALGAAEPALELMCDRASKRVTFGQPVSERANIQDWIAESRIDIEMARLLTLKAAWLMDTVGNKHARMEISAIKIAAPNVALRVVDRAIQVFGGAGVSDDFPLAMMYAHLRTLRLADGPDEIHKRTLARDELRRFKSAEPVA